MEIVGSEDYQKFSFESGKLNYIGDLMRRKLQTLQVEWEGKSLLDVGTDHGFWCFYAAEHGATAVTGLDRGRPINDVWEDLPEKNRALARDIHVDNVAFENVNLGEQWTQYGAHDNVLMLSCYHHVYNNCMDHGAIWYWLWLHTVETLWWEAPLTGYDPVVQKDVKDTTKYVADYILNAAHPYFYANRIAASAIPGREVWKFTPKPRVPAAIPATAVDGAGGASKAFTFENHRRALEIQEILGKQPVPGSLNLRVSRPFDWDSRYFRAQVMDLVDRSKGLESDWAPHWCRFYPVDIAVPLKTAPGFAMRFEKDMSRYPLDFVEVIAGRHLRDYLNIPDRGGVIQLYQI